MNTAPLPSDRRDWPAVWFALLLPTVVTVVYFIVLAGQAAVWQQVAHGVGKVVQFGFPLAWIYWWRSCDRADGSRGDLRRALAVRPQPGELIAGGVLGLAIVTAMAGLYFGWLRSALPREVIAAVIAKAKGIGVGSPARFIAVGVFYSLVHSLLEEYYWRWFVFGRLQSLTWLPFAVGLSAVGFMAHHVCVLAVYFGWTSPLTAFFSLAVAVGGVLWALLYRRYQSLYGVWLCHLLVDAGIFAVGYDLVA